MKVKKDLFIENLLCQTFPTMMLVTAVHAQGTVNTTVKS